MSLTIKKIKDYCVDMDVSNMELNRSDAELFYSNISLKEILTIYSQYKGLKCYKNDDPMGYARDYNLDVLTVKQLI